MIGITDQAGDDGSTAIDELELELRRLPGVRAAGFEQEEGVLLVQLDIHDSPVGSKPAAAMEAVRIAARHAHRRVAVEINRHGTAAPPNAADALGPAATSHAGAGEPMATAEAEASQVDSVSDEYDSGHSSEPELDDNPAPVADEDEETGTHVGRLARVRLLSVLSFPDTDEIEVHLVLGKQRTIGRARASGGIEGVARATIAAVEELRPGFSMRLDSARRADSDGQPLVTVAITLDLGDGARLPVYGIASSSGPMDAAARSTLSALNRHLALLPVT